MGADDLTSQSSLTSPTLDVLRSIILDNIICASSITNPDFTVLKYVSDEHKVIAPDAFRIVYSQVSSKSTGDEIVYRRATSNTAYSKARSKKVVDSERTVSA